MSTITTTYIVETRNPETGQWIPTTREHESYGVAASQAKAMVQAMKEAAVVNVSGVRITRVRTERTETPETAWAVEYRPVKKENA